MLCIDLFCGLGGWTDGFLEEGWNVVGFDIERHVYGKDSYPAQLIIQDALTIVGAQIKDADCIVASPPCQAYSYMALPWTRAKLIAAEYRSGLRSVDELNALFNACFRIQREAVEARGGGRPLPMVVENVRGAQPWVGAARWNYGSFYLWGDVPAIMPTSVGGRKGSGGGWFGDYKRRADKGPGIQLLSMTSSKSPERKAQSARVAKIPLTLSRHIARVFKPI